MGDAEGRVRRVLAEGAYNPRANFNFLAGKGIKPLIGDRATQTERNKYRAVHERTAAWLRIDLAWN